MVKDLTTYLDSNALSLSNADVSNISQETSVITESLLQLIINTVIIYKK